MKIRTIKVDTQIPDLVDRFQGIMNTIPQYVVGRDAELSALKVCLLTRHHLLLEGLPGLAKSRFALLAFRAFKDAQLFRAMFHGQTTTDDVIGPPNTKALRDRGIIEYNTDNMLPTAEFAYLDELFNGPGSVLNATLNILNEREFSSGGKTVQCPLITGVATTNKVSDNPELAALVDRFLIIRQVHPADSEGARRNVLKAFIEADSITEVKFPDTLSMSDLRLLQNAIRKVKIPDYLVNMLEAVRTQYVNSGGGVFVSDRRLCWTYRAMQASILLATGGQYTEHPPMDATTIIADVLARRPGDYNVLETAIAQQFQVYQRAITEEREISDLEKRVNKRIASYSSSMKDSEKRALYGRLSGLVNKLGAVAPEDAYTIAANVERLTNLISRLQQTAENIETDLGLRDAQGNLIDPDLTSVAAADDGEPT